MSSASTGCLTPFFSVWMPVFCVLTLAETFGDRIVLCNPGWPGTHYNNQVGLELI